MRLTVFNGSPRARRSNTRVLTDALVSGFRAGGGGVVDEHYIAGTKDSESLSYILAQGECVLLAFPLYVDSMPSIVKEFIEALEPWKGRLEGVRFCFLVQSGFPEAVHSRAVERYLERLTQRLGGIYLGTVIRGGANAIGQLKGRRRERALEPFRGLGRHLALTGNLDPERIRKLAEPERFSPFMARVLRLLDRTGVLGLIWRRPLKTNGAYERRFDRPFE